ncbi:hypothetical protein FLW53_09505 [Microbispora sp. SCL1-1]|uniref:hypothetical protein n=1 Tax=unclassified Microbispora TaxID=2614687 RepID=UPI00115A4CD0|nr:MULTISPECIES: hypothetical protein [unclassified Microbispora]NJP24438.1 hypothetical protein [Microbispora sp. CL1-1]TQS14586.1 hypothetical protein FLW53_09505 [Microbispora sp. SCL1-1]
MKEQRSPRNIVITVSDSPRVEPSVPPPGKPRVMVMVVSRKDRDWIDEVRARSIDLAYARGHITRACTKDQP